MYKFSIPDHKQTITLWGTYSSLKHLYEVVHHLNESLDCIIHKEGLFMGLCYELRKAFLNEKSSIQEIGPSDICQETGKQISHYYHLYGADINPFILLMSTAYLHQLTSSTDIPILDRAYIYLLVDVTQKAFDNYCSLNNESLYKIALAIAAVAPYEELQLDIHNLIGPFVDLTALERTTHITPLIKTVLSSYKITPC